MGTIEDQYRVTLDECYDPQSLVESYGAARILEELDPIAYRVGLSDYESEYACEDCADEPHTSDRDHLCDSCREVREEGDADPNNTN